MQAVQYLMSTIAGLQPSTSTRVSRELQNQRLTTVDRVITVRANGARADDQHTATPRAIEILSCMLAAVVYSEKCVDMANQSECSSGYFWK